MKSKPELPPPIPTVRRIELDFLRLLLGVPTALLLPFLAWFGWSWNALAKELAKRILKYVQPDPPYRSAVYELDVIYWPVARQFRCEWLTYIFVQGLLALPIRLEISTFFPFVFVGLVPPMALWCSYHSPGSTGAVGALAF